MSLFCLLFWHRWRPQAVRQSDIYRTTTAKAAGETPEGYRTRVLLRCTRCPRVKVQELEGKWSLEELVLGEEMRDPRVKAPTA